MSGTGASWSEPLQGVAPHWDEPPPEWIDAQAELLQGNGSQQGQAAFVAEDHQCGQSLTVQPGHHCSHIPLDDAPVRGEELPPKLRPHAQPGENIPRRPSIAGPGVHEGLYGLPALTLGIADIYCDLEGAHNLILVAQREGR